MADMGLNVDHAAQRAGRYWEIDGLPRIAMGLPLVVIGSLSLWKHQLRASVGCALFVLLALYFYFVMLPNSLVLRWVKARTTFPRTGYVALPPLGTNADVFGLKRHPEGLVLCLMFVSALVVTPWFGAALGVLCASILWIMTKGRFDGAGIFISGSYLSAILLPVLPVAVWDRIGYFSFAFGLLYLFAGAIQLVSYLRRHPVAQA